MVERPPVRAREPQRRLSLRWGISILVASMALSVGGAGGASATPDPTPSDTTGTSSSSSTSSQEESPTTEPTDTQAAPETTGTPTETQSSTTEKSTSDDPTTEKSTTDQTAAADIGIAPMSIPTASADATHAVVSVKVGSYRSGTTTIEPLAGAQLALYDSLNSSTPVVGDWAICTSDADGDCNFVIPNTNQGGTNRDRALYVKAYAAPSGYSQYVAGQLGTGSDVSTSTYGFRVGSGNQLRANNTYTSSGQGADFMISTGQTGNASGGVFQFVRDNPVIQQCGLDVALVLDLSGSIAGYEDDLAGAANTLVDSLTGTDSSVSLYTFSTSSPARTWVGSNNDTGPVIVANHTNQQSVSTGSGANTVKSWYSNSSGDATFTASGGTNWDRGLWAASTSGNDYDVAIVITDGNPTFYAAPPVEGYGSYTRFRELENGIFSANSIKEDGTRVIALGVGEGVDSTASGLNLASISGPTEGSDYFQTDDYGQAAEVLQQMISESCAGTVTVVKQVVPSTSDESPEDITGATPAGGWTFGTSSSNTDVTLPASGTTSTGTGAVNFPLTFPTGTETTDLTITEQPTTDQAGRYTLVTQGGKNAVCTNLTTGDPVTVTNNGEAGFTLSGVDGGSNISCTVYNREHEVSASVAVDKQWVVNGTNYANGDQPEGLLAGLTLSGPGTATSTTQPWATTRTGYTEGDQPSIDETTTIDPILVGCTLDSQQVTEANGETVTESLPYSPTLQAGENEYVVTNVVTCVTKLTLIKQVIGGDAEPDEWSFTAYTVPTVPSEGTAVSGFDGVTPADTLPNDQWGVTDEIDPGTYQFAEQNGPAEYYQQFRGDPDTQQATRPLSTGSWDCTHVDDDLNRVDEWNDGLNGGAVIAQGTHVACIAYNLTGQMTILKYVDGGSSEASDWNLTATPASGVDGLSATTVTGDETITDDNTFYVRPLHDYSITEESLSGNLAYGQVKVQQYTGEIPSDGVVDHTDDSLWTDVDPSAIQVPNDDNAHSVYRIVNVPAPSIVLPLTGGTAQDLFVITGTGLLILTAGAAAWRRRREQAAAK
ncbi:hypothetical protein GCM10009785_16500 [Brooklawnia cerclae]